MQKAKAKPAPCLEDRGCSSQPLVSHYHLDSVLQSSPAFVSTCMLGDNEPACLGTEASQDKERSECGKESSYLLNAEALRSDFHQPAVAGLDFGKVCNILGKL